LPTIKTAKQIAEDALSTIGAFPASQSSPDEGEMKKTLNWLEMLLNYQVGVLSMPGFWEVFDIPLEAGIGDYDLSDYSSDSGVVGVFSTSIVDRTGYVDSLIFNYESENVLEKLNETGRPCRVHVTKDKDMVLKVYPLPTQVEEDLGLVLRVRVQTYQKSIDPSGVGDEDIRLRPSWYLWVVKRLAYEIGSGPVRRLSEGELRRLDEDAQKLEMLLSAYDGRFSGPKPPVTEPVIGSVDCGFDNDGYYNGNGYGYRGKNR